jgi:hypothetical protein
MKQVLINKIDGDVEIIYNDKKLELPTDIIEKINNHWNMLQSSGSEFSRGTVFSICNIENTENVLKIYIQSSDYAHFLYTIHNNISENFPCIVVYVSILVETSDSNLIIGEMACNTATPYRLQCCGGGFDNRDLINDKIDIYNNIKRELYEELGIDLYNTDIVSTIQPKYIKTGGENDFLGLVFKVQLKINQKSYIDLYEKHVRNLISQNIIPEFRSLVFIKSNLKSVKDFIDNDKRYRVDYLEKLLMVEVESSMNCPKLC